MIQLSPTAPAINTKNFPWVRMGNVTMQKATFEIGFETEKLQKRQIGFSPIQLMILSLQHLP